MNSQKAEPELSLGGSQVGGVRQCTVSETPSNRSSAELSQADTSGDDLWIAKIIFIETLIHKHIFMAFFLFCFVGFVTGLHHRGLVSSDLASPVSAFTFLLHICDRTVCLENVLSPWCL